MERERLVEIMRWPWGRASVTVPSNWTPAAAGLVFSDSSASTEAEVSARSYLAQLTEEGYAIRSDVQTTLPWDSLYPLLVAVEHATSLPLLRLPSIEDFLPVLASRGTPSDANFSIYINGWSRRGDGGLMPSLERIGACVRYRSGWSLLSPEVWSLLKDLEDFSKPEARLTAAKRLAGAGHIRSTAIKAQAVLDDYLRRTDIVTATQLGIDVERSEILGAPLLTLTPSIKGAPTGWLATFDRHDEVQDRYHCTTADGGIADVVLSDAVIDALQPIKKLPGRRLASENAKTFLVNPYAVLDEAAASAFDPTELEVAVAAARQRTRHLRMGTESNDDTFPIVLYDLIDDGADVSMVLGFEEASALLQRAGRSLERGVPLVTLGAEEIELSGETLNTLERVERWVIAQTFRLHAAELRYDQVFDLSSYSDRVVGFDGKLTAVPYVGLPTGKTGWLPDELEFGVLTPPREGRPSRAIPFSRTERRALKEAVTAARAASAEHVQVPGFESPVPIAEAEYWLESFESSSLAANFGEHEPKVPKDPVHHSDRPILRILHNIENLDYGALPEQVTVNSLAGPELPSSLRASTILLPHQQQGLAWLQSRFMERAKGLSGVLLADDMGLGKTLQTLCLLEWANEKCGLSKPFLVVAPVSLLENWKDEIRKFFDIPNEKILELYGAGLTEHLLPASAVDPKLREIGLKKFLKNNFGHGKRIVLTTYETLRDHQFSLAREPWGIVVCDEAQRIKNPLALVTRAARALRADFKVACTGTPVENSLADLWCLFDFIQPSLLGSLNQFTKEYRQAIETRSGEHAAKSEELRRAIEPWILRRMKTEVAKDLPRKHERSEAEQSGRHLALPMSPAQAELYALTISQFRTAMRNGQGKGSMLEILYRLRVICSNPMAAAHPRESDIRPIEEHVRMSPKLQWILDQLSVIRGRGEKAILFTEYRDLQRILQRAIQGTFGIMPSIVNGDTTVNAAHSASRQAIINRFQASEGFNAIVLSTTAVGFGVNIQSANHVIHFTRPWNPAKEDQATDRAYRIGQTKEVFVYCPTIAGSGFESFDQRLDKLLSEKRALSKNLFAGVQELTVKDFEDL